MSYPIGKIHTTRDNWQSATRNQTDIVAIQTLILVESVLDRSALKSFMFHRHPPDTCYPASVSNGMHNVLLNDKKNGEWIRSQEEIERRSNFDSWTTSSNSYQIRGGLIIQRSLSCSGLLLHRSDFCVIDLDEDGEVWIYKSPEVMCTIWRQIVETNMIHSNGPRGVTVTSWLWGNEKEERGRLIWLSNLNLGRRVWLIYSNPTNQHS